MFNIDITSIATALDDVKKVVSDNQKNSQYDFEFKSFQVKNHPYRLAAVDGSNHNVRGTNFVFSTLRAGYHLYEKGVVLKSDIDPIKVEFIMNNRDPQVGYEKKHENYFNRITGGSPNGQLDFDKITDHIRTLMEWDKVNGLLEELNENDIIIFDGSLISGEISTSHQFFSSLVEKATSKGISLVGLSKDTSLSIDSASLPVVLNESSKIHHPNQNWFVEYDDKDGVGLSHFVKFSKLRDLIFRVDAVVPPHLEFKDVISWVGSYCFDSMLFGYPYPMQKIHDSVRISESERDYAFSLFKRECLQSGMAPLDFDRMFSIYHNQLDIKSFGR